MNILAEKFRDNVLAVVPITLIVIILNFTIVPLSTPFLIRFIIGSILVIIGLSLFLVGVDLGITPLGSHTGATLTRTNKLVIVLIAGFVLGFFISVAEPGLLVFSNQVDFVTQGDISSISILISVSIGLAIMIGLLFSIILEHIEILQPQHHALNWVVLPVFSFITVAIIASLTSYVEELLFIPVHVQSYWIVALTYTFAFMLPYIIFLHKEKVISRAEKLL